LLLWKINLRTKITTFSPFLDLGIIPTPSANLHKITKNKGVVQITKMKFLKILATAGMVGQYLL
jgi:hypothetical protein